MFELVTLPRSRWSIFDEMESLQEEMNRAFRGWAPAREGRRRGGRGDYPLMNVWSSEAGLVIDVELPGIKQEEIDISVVGDELTLQGKVSIENPLKDSSYLRRERPYGDFLRTLQLPFRADTKGVKATYRNGVLRITVPRSEEEKPKKIEIKAA